MINVEGKCECKVCGKQEKIFEDEAVENAWQLNGQNHYEFTCKVCKSKNILSIDFNDDQTEIQTV